MSRNERSVIEPRDRRIDKGRFSQVSEDFFLPKAINFVALERLKNRGI